MDTEGKYVLRRPPGAARSEPTFRIDYAAELNPAQHEAARHVEGPVLVIAGAGSGKTRTLVYRVARLVELGIAPRSILLLTFTRRAAQSMLQRAAELVGPQCGQVSGGTFHSFANTVLRRHAREIGREPNFTILDRGDSEDVVQLLRAELGFDRKERRFPRKQTVAELFSLSVNRGLPVTALVEAEFLHLAEHADDLERLRTAYGRYKALRNLADYDDLLVLLRDLLGDRREVARRLSNQYRFLMVDEYQDTNRLQSEIVERLALEHQNVMAVGDEAQSIYSFRGADFRNIMDFPRSFPAARIITLEQNYRSTQPILDLANAVIERAEEKYTKILRTEKGGGEPPLLVRAENESYQSRFVCQRILELREEGVPLDDIAVLFRSSFHAFDLEVELGRADVPFVKRGGFKFVESAHVKDLLAHLRVVVNPNDGVSWMRLLCLLEGVGPKTASEIVRHLDGPGTPFGRLASFPRRGAWSDDLRRLASTLEGLAEENPAPEAALERMLDHYRPVLERLHPDDHPRRLRDLEHLATIAGRYRALESMLADFALEPPSDSVDGGLDDADGDEGRLTLSTIHSAKGLEWDTVFLLWAAEGKFPSSFRHQDADELEEERRLFYVAITRAKRRLYLSYPMQYYERGAGLTLGRPTRFVEGIPESLLPPVAVVEEEEPF